MVIVYHFSYLIPSNANEYTVNPCDIIKLYLETLEKDIPNFHEMMPTLALFMFGSNKEVNSKFSPEAIGRNVLSKVPSMIAEYLGLNSPEDYILTSFKNTLK